MQVATPEAFVVDVAVTTLPFDFVILKVTLAPAVGDVLADTLAVIETVWLRV